MRRRAVIALLGGVAAVRPLGARAQPTGRMLRIGMVEPISAELNAGNLAAFRRGLRDLGYVEGRNLVLIYRSAEGDAGRFPALVAELLSLDVDLIVTRGTPASLAAKDATTTTPVVMMTGEPLLVVASLARPGGNITGLSGQQLDLTPKRLELLREMAPATSGVAAFLNMGNPISARQLTALERAAQTLSLRFQLHDLRDRADIERAFRAIDKGTNAIVVEVEGVTQAHRFLIAGLAAEYLLPAIYGGREFVEAGGLMFYGPSYPDQYRRVATYVDKILKGARPADLPIEQLTRIEFAINLKTAKALGLEIPPLLLQQADEVIE
jgi:putative tryptophan/tyrosine transport system substrate-binding protein